MKRAVVLLILSLLAIWVLPHLLAGSNGSMNVTLRDVLAKPHTFKDIPIRMICIFHKLESLDMPFYTKYTSDQYVSFSAWPSDARLWEKKEHMEDHPLFFIDRSQEVAKDVISLVPYQFVEIRGTVTSTFGNLPWIEVSSIKPLDKRRFSRQSLRHLVGGLALLEHEQFSSAAERLEQALTLKIPENAELLALRKLGHCYHMLKDYSSATRWYTKALKLAPGDEEIENALKKIKEDEHEARRRARMEGKATEPQGTETVEQLREQLAAKQNEIRELVRVNEELVAELDNRRIRIEELLLENEELVNALKAIAERPAEVTAEEDALRKRPADVEAALAKKEELIEQLRQKATGAGFEIDVMELADLVGKLAGELEDARARLKDETAKLTEENAALKLQLVAMERENNELSEKLAGIAQKERELKELERKLGDSQAILDELDATRKARAELEARIQKLEEENEALKDHAEKLEQEKNALIASAQAGTDAMLREQLAEYEKALAERDAELRGLKDEIEKVRSHLKETESSFEKLRADTSKGVNELVAEFRKMEKELASKKKESEDLAEALKELMKERQAERLRETKVEQEISRVKSTIAQLEARLAEATDEEREKINIQLEKERTALLELRKVNVENLRGEYNRVSSELERERRTSAELRSQVESLKAQVESLKEKVNRLENRKAPAGNGTAENTEGE